MDKGFEIASAREYLLTNGLGSYSSSTMSGANTRRYHGLLVASFNPPTERLVMVSKIEETVRYNGHEYPLSSNQYPGVIYPEGFRLVDRYEADGKSVRWTYGAADWLLTKQIEMADLENKVWVTYANASTQQIELEVNPLCVYRDYHALFHESGEFDFYQEKITEKKRIIYARYGAHPLFVEFSEGNWTPDNNWYKSFEYAWEQRRGFPANEDAVSVGKLSITLEPMQSVWIAFSTEPVTKVDAKLAEPAPSENDHPQFVSDLIGSSRQFVVRRKSTNGETIIAGYPWFTDWGRDTMIAVRGISIATGRQNEARNILETFLSVLSEGMLPNRFPDYPNEPLEYNTIDATLWLFVALFEYYQKFQDTSLIAKAMKSLGDVIDWHIKGTRYGIHVTDEGLLYGGEAGVQLTWMDAKVDGVVITPRIGCPVEINALWYNALCIYRFFSRELSIAYEERIDHLIEKCRLSMGWFFTNENGYLNDVVIPGAYVDDSIRPNQIYAVSLPFSPISKAQQDEVLDCITEKLLTPLGLRTLDAEHADFKATYEGNAWSRDSAYHQGTVWPFLWGEWALAYLRKHDFDVRACEYVWRGSSALQHHFYNEGCARAIAEVFDGLEPSVGKGCVQQAWSVGMLLSVFLHPHFNWSFLTQS
jgi:predicted glycogen debranching enzyme